MKHAIVLGLVALVPAAVGAAPVRGVLAVCGGGIVAVPLDHQGIPGAEQPGCCAKGCHIRRRHKRFDRAQ